MFSNKCYRYGAFLFCYWFISVFPAAGQLKNILIFQTPAPTEMARFFVFSKDSSDDVPSPPKTKIQNEPI